MVRGWLTLLILMTGAACNGGGRLPAAEPPAASAKSPPVASSRPSRWLLHAFSANVVDASRKGPVGITYTASYVGPERVEKSLALPPAIKAGWSPDGRWLALCSVVTSGSDEPEVHQAVAIRFDGDRASAPIQLGECTSFDWAPVGQRLLIQNGRAWRIVDFSGPARRETPIVGEVEAPVAWSPNGRRFLARAADAQRSLRVVHALEPSPHAEALGFDGRVTRWCRWGPQDALACAVQTLGAPPESAIEILYAGAGVASSVPLPAYVDSFEWANEQTLVYELEREGGLYAHHSGTTTQLTLPGRRAGLAQSILSPKGTWLLDTVTGNARLWNLASTPHSTILLGMPGPLVNARWSRNGKHAVLGVVHPRGTLQTDVWLVTNATTNPTPTRIATAGAGQASSASFSPGSEWAFVSMGPDIIPLAGASAPTKPVTTLQSSAVHIATLTTLPLTFTGDWASDDSAFVTAEREGGRVLLVRVQGNTFRPAEVLRATRPDRFEVLWQPGPG